ncbi:malic enzyme-like NAD(P)-binding protein [Bradyrhizobium niftali]|uniref:malic enzyme-like NAD(P)-binding protein n=1 Tax=Bradyrhizobium niftali TaxID=2560055 RepID=UPI001F3CB725|nr:malic enzyme-like NAD(P)-binding protein [Bradyrhizobium niftali]
MLLLLGAKKENIYVSDSKGLVVEDRLSSIDPWRAQFAQKADARHLSDVMSDADVYLGLSVAGALTQDMVRKMASNPFVQAHLAGC